MYKVECGAAACSCRTATAPKKTSLGGPRKALTSWRAAQQLVGQPKFGGHRSQQRDGTGGGRSAHSLEVLKPLEGVVPRKLGLVASNHEKSGCATIEAL